MSTTKTAERYIEAMRQVMGGEAFDLVMKRAHEIRVEARAPRLGRSHLESALDEVSEWLKTERPADP